MSLLPRVKQMKEEHVPKHFWKEGYVGPVYISILRTRSLTRVWKETEGEPLSIRRAKVLADYLDTMPLFIRPFECLVGYLAEDPHALPLCLEAWDTGLESGKGLEEYIKAGLVKKDEIEEWREYQRYWHNRGLNKILDARLTEKEKKLAWADHAFMEVLPTQYTTRAQPEQDLYLSNGALNGRLEYLRKKLSDFEQELENSAGGDSAIGIIDKINDLKAMIIATEAVIRWANRYSKLAKEMAEKESNHQRKKELEKISEHCSHVPANEPRSYWEALQSHLLVSTAYQMIELLSHGTSLRLDQWFWPSYEKDVLINKTLKREEALALMEEFLLHINEWGRPLPLVWRKSLQGNNFLATYTIGGVKPEDGSDACNETTILIMDALDELRLNHPDFKFRWHPKVDQRAFQRCLELNRSGLGQPSIKNDPVVIEGLMSHYGFTLEEARSWAVVGCISPAPTLNWGRCRRDAWTVFPAKVLELALFNGINPTTDEDFGFHTGDARKFQTFDELFEAYRKQFGWVMRTSARIKTIAEDCTNKFLKRPFLSVLFRRSLNACRDLMDTPEKGMPWVNDPGIVDAVDSLIGLKKLVYDDKKYKMDEVLKALKADWKGYEEMRLDFVNNAPKFGNDDTYADMVAKQTYAMVADEMSKVKDINNTSPMPSGLIITWMFSTADKVGALPNGRKKGDYLVDGGISPHAGFDKNGPMAGVLSASKIDSRRQKANIYNQKFTPTTMEGKAGLKKFENYVVSSLDLGLDMIQFNVVDRTNLIEAQKHPENYPNLVVRVSGYNANFVELDKFVQDAVIERTQHNMI
jgi:benzylsuccinate synthase